MHHGRMIVPYQPTGDGHLMATNLSKYFRVTFALIPRPPDRDMLQNVSFKVFKVENVPPYRNDPDKKTELKARAVETADLYGGNITCGRQLGDRRWVGGAIGCLIMKFLKRQQTKSQYFLQCKNADR